MEKTPVPQHDLNLNPTDENVQLFQGKMDVLIATLSELETIFTRYSEACQPMKELFSASKQQLVSLRSGRLDLPIKHRQPERLISHRPDTERKLTRSKDEEQLLRRSFRGSSTPPVITDSHGQSPLNPTPVSPATPFSTGTDLPVSFPSQQDSGFQLPAETASAPLFSPENQSDTRNDEHDFIQNLLNLQKEFDRQSPSRISLFSQSSMPDVSESFTPSFSSSPASPGQPDSFSSRDSDLFRNLFSFWEKLDKLPSDSSELSEQWTSSETPSPIKERNLFSPPVDVQCREIEQVQKSIEKNTRELLHLVEKTNEYLRELLGNQRDEITVEVE